MRKILVSILVLLVLSLSSIVSAADNRQQDNQQQDPEKQRQEDQQHQEKQQRDKHQQDQQQRDQQLRDKQQRDQQLRDKQQQDQQPRDKQQRDQQLRDKQQQDQQPRDKQQWDQQLRDKQQQDQQRQNQQHYDWSHPTYHNDNWHPAERRADESLPFRWHERHDRYYGDRIDDNQWADRFPGLQPYRWHGEDFWYRGHQVTDAVLFYNDSDELVSVGFMDNGVFVFIRDDNESYENHDSFFLLALLFRLIF